MTEHKFHVGNYEVVLTQNKIFIDEDFGNSLSFTPEELLIIVLKYQEYIGSINIKIDPSQWKGLIGEN